MKIKTFYIPIFFLVIDIILSLPQLYEHMRIIGSLRLVFIPILVIILSDQIKKVDEKRIIFAISMSWPLLLLMILFLIQIVVIPRAALSIHLSGCAKYISWTLLYVCALLSLNSQTIPIIRRILLFTLLLVFLAIIIQYPILIQQSSEKLSGIVASYGSQEKDIFGLFGAGNEDANSLMTLFPFALFYVRQKSGLNRLLLKIIILIYIPIVLFVNGTRTALFITFPIVIFLFHFSLSFKNLIKVIPFFITLILLYITYVANFAESSFASESQGEGTWGFRVNRVWIPASNYTSENSPLWGFGSRGWEYVCTINRIVRSGAETNAFEVIPSHNVYVWTYVSWGIVGFFIYLAFLMILLKETFFLSMFSKLEVSLLGKTLLTSVIAYCIWAYISNATIEAAWGILLAISILIASVKMTVLLRNKNSVANKRSLKKN